MSRIKSLSCANDMKESPNPMDIHQTRVYTKRFVILALFSLSALASGSIWISFASVNSQAASFYNVSTTQVNWLTLIFSVVSIPFYFIDARLVHRYGLRFVCSLGSILHMMAALARILSAHNRSYAWAMLGQALAGMAQPVFLSLPARVSGEWFPLNERDSATVASTMANQIGCALGQLFPALIVNQTAGFSTVAYVLLGMAGVPCILTLLFFEEKPPIPPSLSVSRRDTSNVSRKTEFRNLMKKKAFICVVLGFGIFNAVQNTLSTLLEQMIRRFGYSSTNAGTLGFLLTGFGILGAILSGRLLDRFHAYQKLLRILSFVNMASLLGLLYSINANNFLTLCILMSFYGFFFTPVLPLALACAAEATYPTVEEVSSGIVMLSVNIFSVSFMWIGELINNLHIPSWSSTPIMGMLLSPFGLLLLTMNFAAVCLFFSYKTKYLRLRADLKIAVSSIQ